MNQSKDGGAAFPQSDVNLLNYEAGMSLRDYFAAKAMQGWLATFVDTRPGSRTAQGVAGFAYEIADAMLKARSE